MALSRADGQIRWTADLTHGWLGSGGFVHLVVDGDCVFASTQGEVYCLDAVTGNFRWCNGLKGCGLGIASMATASRNSPADLGAQSAAQEQRQTAATTAAVVAATTV